MNTDKIKQIDRCFHCIHIHDEGRLALFGRMYGKDGKIPDDALRFLCAKRGLEFSWDQLNSCHVWCEGDRGNQCQNTSQNTTEPTE